MNSSAAENGAIISVAANDLMDTRGDSYNLEPGRTLECNEQLQLYEKTEEYKSLFCNAYAARFMHSVLRELSPEDTQWDRSQDAAYAPSKPLGQGGFVGEACYRVIPQDMVTAL
ncbi:unnamed protein product [Strongylus vulgaris]|uniref:Uncharacterized protein n=1 Tax=Strongylus vulgaris TaxID=40348 RepID=A0A3P7IY24_STRVU|nr:unnamed protein product [Strongylus vulgaris]